MKLKYFVAFSFILMFMSCKNDIEDFSVKVRFGSGEKSVYVFNTIEEIEDRFQDIVQNETGEIRDVSYMKDELESKKNDFKFPTKEYYDNHQNEYYYLYPDFSGVQGDYIAVWDKKKHLVSSGPVDTYELTYAVHIYKYDRENEICSEPLVIDTKIYVTYKIS